MTNRDAIEKLREIANFFNDAFNQTNKNKSTIEALDLAIQALEKQEPKKPIKFNRCPNCNEDVTYTNVESEDYGMRYNYCPNCGQVIDWSE